MVWWVVSQEFRHNIKSQIRCILKKCFSLYLNLKKPIMRNGVFLWMLQKALLSSLLLLRYSVKVMEKDETKRTVND